MLTAAEVRASALAYHQLEILLKHPLTPESRAAFEHLKTHIEGLCEEVSGTCSPSRWARDCVGPVLAAALGAATYMREDIRTPTGALRVFGLSGSHTPTNAEAWRLAKAYLQCPVVPPTAIAELSAKMGVRLHLNANPSPAELLTELSRPRASHFAMQVSQWLIAWFRLHSADDTNWGRIYREELVDLQRMNARRGFADGIKLPMIRLEKGDWEELIAGRLPERMLEYRAALVVTRRFLVEYWHQWQPEARHAPERCSAT